MYERHATPPYPPSEAAEKYDRLRSQKFISSLLQLFHQRPDDTLLSFEQVQQLVRGKTEIKRGTQSIPIANIVGSVGRYRDFTRAFLPLRGANQERWKQLDVALNELRDVPPIEVYKIGDVYFVRDGNHRVSVAKANGLTHIEADVTEIPTRVTLSPDIDLDQIIIKAEHAEFLEATCLDHNRRGQTIEVTEPGRYKILLEHIEIHRYYLGLELQRDVSLEEAATSWYDTVYTPIVEAIRESGVLKEFPRRTEADLYLWVSYHRERLRERYGHMPEDVDVASGLAERYSERPMVGFVRTVARAIRAAVRAVSESPEPPAPSEATKPAQDANADENEESKPN